MSASEGKADIASSYQARKKPAPRMGPAWFLGSGGRMAFAPSGLSWSRRPYSDAPRRGASACSCFPAGSNLSHFQMKKGPTGGPFIHLVAGARFALFLQSRGECVSSDILSVGSAKRSDSRPIPGTSGLSHTMEFLILLRKACHSGSFDSCSGSILMACE